MFAQCIPPHGFISWRQYCQFEYPKIDLRGKSAFRELVKIGDPDAVDAYRLDNDLKVGVKGDYVKVRKDGKIVAKYSRRTNKYEGDFTYVRHIQYIIDCQKW